MCILIGVSELLFFSPQLFLVKNVKMVFFCRKMGLNIVFIEMKCRRLQTSLADGLGKTLNMKIFSMGRFFTHF